MANTEKIVVQVVVQGDKQLDNLQKKTKSTTKSFGNMGASILAAATAFTTITRTIGSAIRSFRDFEFQMAKVKAVTGASEKDFHKLTKTAKELGRSTFFTAQQVAELQTNFGKLGFSTEEILNAQEATLLLATATDADLGRAAIVAGAAVRGFGLDATETSRVVDVMTKAFSSSALDIEKFQTSMTKVAPIAAGANITLESTSAVMGTLTDAGIEASIAGTSLRNIFLKMQDSSSALSKHLGFTVNSSDDLQRALTILNKEGLSNEEIMELVDLRQVAAFQTMVNGSDRIQQLTEDFNNANGAAKEMADIVGDTLEGAFKRMTSASEGLAIELTEKLGVGLKDLIDNIALFINRMTDNSDAIAKNIKILIKVIKWIGIYKVGVIAARIATRALSAATLTAAAAMQTFRIALTKTGIGILVIGLGELAAKFLLTNEKATETAQSINEVADASERLETRNEAFDKKINKQLGNTIEKSKENIKLLEEEDRIRFLSQANHSRGIFKMSKLERKATKEERKRIQDKIALEEANQIELQGIIDKELEQKKSLIVLQEEELKKLERLPELTEKQISDKHKLIAVVEKEIKRLKELGKEKNNTKAQDKIKRRQLLIELGLQQDLIDKTITQEQFDDQLREKKIKNIQSVLDNDKISHEVRMNLLKQRNNLILQSELIGKEDPQDKIKRRELQIELALQEQLLNAQITQDEFENIFHEKQLKNIKSVLDNEMLSHPIRMELQKQYNDLVMEGLANEKNARQKQIGDMDMVGQQLITLAGEDEKYQKIREAGIKISAAAALATNAEALALQMKGLSASLAEKFPKNIIAVASTLALLMSIRSNMAALSGEKKARGGMIEEFANGGMVNGKSHAQGGEKFAVGGRVVELEGGEAVINKRSTSMFRNQLSAMNSAGGGVKFADGGLLNMPSFSQQQFNAVGQNQMMGAMGGASKVVVVEADITSTQNSVSVIEADAII